MTVKRYLKSGRLRAVHLSPRAVRIRHAELERFLALPAPAGAGAMPKEQQTKLRTPSHDELARRRAVVERILARRPERGSAPVTSAELVRRAREKAMWNER